jgi:methionyl-tRNA formyltransferase
MRIALFGQAPFGKDVLDALRGAGHEIAVVYTPPDTPERPDPLAARARELGLALEQPRRYRPPEVFERFQTYAPELNVLAFVTAIIPESILFQPPHQTIEYHPSLLPRHRGRSAMNWAIINGEERTGLTIFWVDAGIDTGPILLQKEVAIDPVDTVATLYFNKLYPLGVEALVEAIRLVGEGRAPKIPQDEAEATSEPPCEDEHAQIVWAESAQTVYNLIRGTNPQPGAWTTHRGRRLRLFDAALRPEHHPHADRPVPGTVTQLTKASFLVAAAAGAIEVKRVQPEGAGKIKAGEFIASAGLEAGERLGEASPLPRERGSMAPR